MLHVVRVDPGRSASCTLRTPICRHFAVAFAFAASRARPCSASLQPWYEPTTRQAGRPLDASTYLPSTDRPGPSHSPHARSAARADEVTLHLLTHAWVARAVRLPAGCARGPA